MINLNEYGFTEFFEKQLTNEDVELELIPARVTSIQKETYELLSQFGSSIGKLKASIFYQNISYTIYPAVGDFVLIKHNPMGDDIIYKVLDRKTCFSRENPSLRVALSKASEQIVASNFDYTFIMASLNKDFNIKRIQRYISIAIQTKAIPVIVLTKADCCEDSSYYTEQVYHHFPSTAVCVISSHSGYGMESLYEYILPGKTIVLLGSSGIGKSSLVNYLLGKDVMLVNTIRDDDSKGRHTTTHRQMLVLDNGGIVIDTPGMRELGLWNADEGVSYTFVDVEELAKTCRFSDCTHKKEPGCAIRAGLLEGTITDDDVDSYYRLKKEIRRNNARTRMFERQTSREDKYKSKKARDEAQYKSHKEY